MIAQGKRKFVMIPGEFKGYSGKEKMKKFVCIFYIFMIIFCPSAKALNKWTVMLYLVSDDFESNAILESHLEALHSLSEVGSHPNEYEIVVLLDSLKTGASIFSFKSGKIIEGPKLGQTNMGAPQTLWNFVKSVVKDHPARQYALIIGGHGSGIFSWWGNGNVSDFHPGTVQFDPEKFVAYDDTDKDCLTVFEIQAVLETFRNKLNFGKPLNLLVFDSCMPGSIEAVVQFSRCVEIMVASPESTLVGGMPYGKVFGKLSSNVNLTSEQLGKIFATEYIAKTASMTPHGEVVGIFRPIKSEKLVGKFNLLSIELLKAFNSENTTIFKNLIAYGEDSRYWDIGKALASIVNGETDLSVFSNGNAIKQTAIDVFDELKQTRIDVFYSGKFEVNKVSGLSIAWPKKEEYVAWRSFYKALAFSKETHWDEFLDSWHYLNQKKQE